MKHQNREWHEENENCGCHVEQRMRYKEQTMQNEVQHMGTQYGKRKMDNGENQPLDGARGVGYQVSTIKCGIQSEEDGKQKL